MKASASVKKSPGAWSGEQPVTGGIRLLGDSPVTEDLLGYQPYVRALTQVLASEGLDTPFTVGIFGRWGTGKSTFMAMLRDGLSRGAPQRFHSLLFQPWQFEDKQEVWRALLLSALRYLEKELTEHDSRSARDMERLSSTLRTLIIGVGKLALDKATTTLSGGLVGADDLLKAYAETQRDNTQFINTFRAEFKELRDEILALDTSASPRMFIFVDDLDRCTPDNCVAVLEAIKLFFDFSGCVFVLGIDRDVVQRGIELKYRDSIRLQGQDYLDKMIQLPFSLPPISRERFQAFVRHTTEGLGFSEAVFLLLAEASEGNPRRLKRLSNCFQLVRGVALTLQQEASAELGEPLDEGKLALLLMLQVRYPLVFSWLSRHPITLPELDRGWQDPTGSGPSEPGHRTRIVAELEDSYGRYAAELVAERFRKLWHFAHSEASVPHFSHGEQVAAYLGIAGVVEEDRAKAERAQAQVHADQAVDAHYRGSALLGLDAEAPTSQSQPLLSPERRRELVARSKERLTQLQDRWRAFTQRSLLSSAVGYLRLRVEGEEILGQVEQQLRQAERLQDPGLNHFIVEFKHLESSGRRILDAHVAAVARFWMMAIVLAGVTAFLIALSSADGDSVGARLSAVASGAGPNTAVLYIAVAAVIFAVGWLVIRSASAPSKDS